MSIKPCSDLAFIVGGHTVLVLVVILVVLVPASRIYTGKGAVCAILAMKDEGALQGFRLEWYISFSRHPGTTYDCPWLLVIPGCVHGYPQNLHAINR